MISYRGPYSTSYRWAPRLGQAPVATVSPVEGNDLQSKEATVAINAMTMVVVAVSVGVLAFLLGQMSASKD